MDYDKIKSSLREYLNTITDDKEKIKAITDIKDMLFELSPVKHNPVDNVKWVPVEMVEANDYNPNSVAKREMQLLYVSISHDGYTQPIVTILDKKKNKYVIVDGFHRYAISKAKEDIREGNKGLLPIVVIDKDINDRMASTIRHNRARGKHSIEGMSEIVLKMLKNNWTDEQICEELGLEAEELVRLKHITGFAVLFKDRELSKSWVTTTQIKEKKDKFSKDKKDER